jgi:hypothetical protein
MIAGVVVERDQANEFNTCWRRTDRRHSDLRRLIRRVSIDSGRDGRERHGAGTKSVGYFEAATVTGRQNVGFRVAAALPDRSDSVDDVTHRRIEVECRGRHRVAGLAGCNSGAGLGQARSGGPMDGAIDTAATEQGLVRGRHDRVNTFLRDITLNDLNHGHDQIVAHRVVNGHAGWSQWGPPASPQLACVD